MTDLQLRQDVLVAFGNIIGFWTAAILTRASGVDTPARQRRQQRASFRARRSTPTNTTASSMRESPASKPASSVVGSSPRLDPIDFAIDLIVTARQSFSCRARSCTSLTPATFSVATIDCPSAILSDIRDRKIKPENPPAYKDELGAGRFIVLRSAPLPVAPFHAPRARPSRPPSQA